MHPAAFSTFLHGALETRMGRLLELTQRSNWTDDPAHLHDVRVASRRARAVLDLIDSRFYLGFQAHRRRLKRLTRALGAVRGLDVQLALLHDLKSRGLEPIHQAVLEHAEESIECISAKARRRMTRMLSDLELEACRELLNPRDFPALKEPQELRGAARTALESASRGLDQLPGLAESEDPNAMHALRIQVKRFRYAVEILAPLMGSGLDALPGRLKQLQTVLGNHHDLVELETFLWSLHSQLTSRSRAVLATELLDILGLVAELRRQRFQEFSVLAGEFASDSPLDALRATDAP